MKYDIWLWFDIFDGGVTRIKREGIEKKIVETKNCPLKNFYFSYQDNFKYSKGRTFLDKVGR